MDIFIEIALSIDRTIYTWIPSVYELIVKLAGYEVFSPEQINGLSRRVYALIGIFMLFKLSFSMISYIVNPDDFSDKSKGFGGLIKNVIISLVLIVAVPYIFAEATYVQKMILEDGTIIKMVLPAAGAGDEEGNDRSSVSYANRGAGEQISFILFTQFVKPNDVIPSIKESCRKLYKVDENGKRVHVENSAYAYQLNDECKSEISNQFNNSDIWGNKNEANAAQYYIDAMEYQNYNILVNHPEIFKAEVDNIEIYANASEGKTVKSNVKIIKYNWLLCMLFGIVVLLFLITLCIDVAARTIKLAFYQIIAPVPIISNCDPKGKKDGMLQKWTKACISTYLDLFIRLLMFFLAIFIIRAFSEKFLESGSESAIIVFIIIGALVFAKQAPKIIEDLTGLKIENFTLNPIKKVQTDALLGKNIVGAMGGAAAGTVGMLTGAGVLRSLGGALSGAVKGKGFFDSYNSTLDMNKKIREARLNNSSFLGRATAGIATRIGIPTGSELIGARIHNLDEEIKDRQNKIKNIELTRDGEKTKYKESQRRHDMVKKSFGDAKTTFIEKMKEGKGTVGKNYNHMNDVLTALQNQVGKKATWTEVDVDGVTKTFNQKITANDISRMSEKVRKFEQDGWQKLIEETAAKIAAGEEVDAKLKTKLDVSMKDFATAFKDNIDHVTADGKVIHYYEIKNDDGTVTRYTEDEVSSNGKIFNTILGHNVGESSRDEAEQRKIDEKYYKQIKDENDKIEELERDKRVLYDQERTAKSNESARTFQ